MRRLLPFIVCLLCCASLKAQHWMGVSVDGNMAWSLDKIEHTTAKLGGGTSVGLRYQFQSELFTLETGVGVAYGYAARSIHDSLYRSEQIDSKGQVYTLNTYHMDRMNVSHALSVHLPVMVGVELNYFYAQAGLKAGLTVRRYTRLTERVATTGDYDIFYDPLVNMPNHGFHDYELQQSRSIVRDLVPDLRLTAEIGTSLYPFIPVAKYRLGLFVEYGVINAPDVRFGMRFTVLFSGWVPRSYPCKCLKFSATE